GTGLIGGSFALALRKYATDLHISGWDRPEVSGAAEVTGAFDAMFSGDGAAAALRDADLVFVALPIGVTINLLSEIARMSPTKAWVTAACSTKLRVVQAGEESFEKEGKPLFLGGPRMAGGGVSGIAHANAVFFRGPAYALVGPADGEGAAS